MLYKPPYLQTVWHLTLRLFSLAFRCLKCFPKCLCFLYLTKLQPSVPVTSSPDYLTNLYHTVDFYVVLSVFFLASPEDLEYCFLADHDFRMLVLQIKRVFKSKFFFSIHMADLLYHVRNC